MQLHSSPPKFSPFVRLSVRMKLQNYQKYLPEILHWKSRYFDFQLDRAVLTTTLHTRIPICFSAVFSSPIHFSVGIPVLKIKKVM